MNNTISYVILLCLIGRARLLYSQDDVAVMVCRDLEKLLTFPSLRYGNDPSYAARQVTAKQIELDALQTDKLKAVAENTSQTFLTRRIAANALVFRVQKDICKLVETHKFASNTWMSPPDVVRRQQRYIDDFAKVEFRQWWEYRLLFTVPSDVRFVIRGISVVHSQESLPLLKSYYEWGAYRVSEIGSKIPVRNIVASGIGNYHSVEALEVLSSLYSENFATAQDKVDLVNVLATDEKWVARIENLTQDQREKFRLFLDAVAVAKKTKTSVNDKQ